MRIAIVHSFYSSAQPSGENRVVEDQARALRQAGHDVLLLGRHTDDEQRMRTYPLRAAWRVSSGRGPDPTERLVAFAPDVVHIHNLFPNIGTDWVSKWPGPVVVSIHNYRSVCSNGLLFREGEVCTECPQQGNQRAVIHGCYRGSRLATIPVAASRRRDRLNLLRRADAVVTTSEASGELLRTLLPFPMRGTMIPNFGPGEAVDPLPASQRDGWVALGRMSPEKGFRELVRDWPEGQHLTLIGDGEEQAEVWGAARGKSIAVLSTVPREELRTMLPRFTGLVFPSLWPEVAPQVVVEAMRVGLPVVADERNGVADLVVRSGAGGVYHDPTSLRSVMETVRADCDNLSDKSIRHYSRNWTPAVWLNSISELYAQVAGRGDAREISL